MTDDEIEKLGRSIAAALREQSRNCPYGLDNEQAQAIKQIADGFNMSRKAAWKTVWKGFGWIIAMAIFYGLMQQFTDFFKSIK